MAEGTFSCDGKAIYDAVGLTERVEQVERNYARPTDVVGAKTYPADEEGASLVSAIDEAVVLVEMGGLVEIENDHEKNLFV